MDRVPEFRYFRLGKYPTLWSQEWLSPLDTGVGVVHLENHDPKPSSALQGFIPPQPEAYVCLQCVGNLDMYSSRHGSISALYSFILNLVWTS